ncbi:hypothetical protein ERICII_03004 [Paenibacillus larvae subsp. larvae DSM 25430]|nr:hypothetical protein ERICII_03004 [Paenibacillus larvae subsp. larvae DSM 25430]
MPVLSKQEAGRLSYESSDYCFPGSCILYLPPSSYDLQVHKYECEKRRRDTAEASGIAQKTRRRLEKGEEELSWIHFRCFYKNAGLSFIIGIVVIMLAWKLFKALLKWIVILAVLAAVVIYGSSYVTKAEGSPIMESPHQAADLKDISSAQV